MLKNLSIRGGTMKIPKQIKVAGITYVINEVPYVEVDQSKDYAGVCDYNSAEIQLLESLGQERKEQTLIHELTHAIFKEAGYDEQDEDMINRVGIVLHQVIRDNRL